MPAFPPWLDDIRYVIYNHEIRPGILRNAVGWYYRLLDENRMQ